MALQNKPPVVTILGHVDHGKTTLIDYIRSTSVADKEHGGITQSIGAYQAEVEGKLITFIDTPGHAAFEKMRSRGAQVADIAVLVVAIDDGVMPQTVEAIKHIQAARVPMIVAVNKVDLPGVDVKVQIEKIKKQLTDNHVLVEEYGGDVPVVKVSAKTGQGINDLLETINLISDIHECKADPDAQVSGVIIESHTDKFKGPTATVLLSGGTVRVGDILLAGSTKGKVKGLFDYRGASVASAGPSTPVEVLGFQQAPAVGSALGEEAGTVPSAKFQAQSLIDKLKEVDTNTLKVVVKSDKHGSLEAIESLLEKLNQDERHIKIISSATGEIVDSDVEFAYATGAIIIGFNVAVKPTASRLAETHHVLIRTYKIIYELLEEMEDVVEGMLKPGEIEEVFGVAQIIAEFPFGKGERIAGCKVVDGVISKGPKVRIMRDEEKVGDTRIKSIKRLKEELSKVEKSQDCGMLFDPQVDFKIGDIVESYRTL